MENIISPEKLLNQIAYPSYGDNARRKDTPKHDTITFEAGVNEYQFFTQPLGNVFQRNSKMPISGTEVYFVYEIFAHLQEPDLLSVFQDWQNLLQASYLEISVNNRRQLKIPAIEFMGAAQSNQVAADSKFIEYWYRNSKKLEIPIIINSTSQIDVRFVTTPDVANTLQGSELKLTFNTIQFDKLESYWYNPLKGNQYQTLSETMYDTFTIPSVTEQTYNIYADNTKSKNLISKVLDLSSIERIEVQALEIFFTVFNRKPIMGDPYYDYLQFLLNDLVRYNLQVTIDDVEIFYGSIENMLSYYILWENVPSARLYSPNKRQNHVLRTPIILPANGKVSVRLIQPPLSAVGYNVGENPIKFTVLFKGKTTRRVA